MTNQHSITPPPELVEEWVSMLEYHPDEKVFSKVAQWGADQELEACCMWITREKSVITAEELGIARRPKLLGLKEQALESVKRFELGQDLIGDLYTIRCALEALPDG
jgi:hypothetical protein